MRRAALVAICAGVASIAGCGGQDPKPAPARAQAVELSVKASALSPSQLTVVAPGPVRLRAINRDRSAQVVAVEGPGVRATRSLLPGQNAILDVRLRAGQRYVVSNGSGATAVLTVGRRPASGGPAVIE
jgi:hypothetical protein